MIRRILEWWRRPRHAFDLVGDLPLSRRTDVAFALNARLATTNAGPCWGSPPGSLCVRMFWIDQPPRAKAILVRVRFEKRAGGWDPASVPATDFSMFERDGWERESPREIRRGGGRKPKAGPPAATPVFTHTSPARTPSPRGPRPRIS